MSSPKFVFSFTPKTKSQQRACKAFLESEVLFINGAAGTGKSFLALALALQEVNQGRKKHVIYCRTMIEAGGSIGFLPGNVEEKYSPYLGAVQPILGKMAFKLPPDVIRYEPLTFLRSLTFDDCVAVLDEAQNASLSQIKLFMTRMGQNCKLLIAGDPDQCDIKPTQSEFYVDLDYVMERLQDVKGVSIIDFDPTHVLRHSLVSEFTKRL